MAYTAAKELALPALVTSVFCLCYLAFDVISIGGLRRRHGILFPRMSGHEEFERAYRAQMNQLEQMPIFFASMWLSALLYDPTFAGSVGALWVCLRVRYGFVYRGSADRGALMKMTLPAYFCVISLLCTVYYSCLLAYFGDKSRAVGGAVVLAVGIIYGGYKNRMALQYGGVVAEEKKN
eukprot:comp10878_c1_seq1/m.5485 comp10878_c1_seq1/g.5485  ORF comp10878_c1_seq1/g.5485 comp10878_c1_seq1/m.5485 type:complete len:179 (-) comp10878_c1_seq1:228-764(-)